MMNTDALFRWLQKNMVNVVILVVFIIIALKVNAVQQQKILELSQQRDNEQQKNEVLSQIVQSEKALKKSAKLVNSKQLDSVINDITSRAKDAEITIQQVNPRPEETVENGIYKKYSYDISIIAPGYHAIGQFVSALEKSAALYSVDSLSFRSDYEPARNKFRVVAEMTISTLWLVE